jgi:hypothetical protein
MSVLIFETSVAAAGPGGGHTACMKNLALCAGLLLALSAGAEEQVRAKLVGQRVISSYPGSPILVCRYAGAGANYEVVASAATCAPYLSVD